MKRLMNGKPRAYSWLDAEQLIKHAFGLAHTYGQVARVTLLYFYWEPVNHADFPQFAEHRDEVDEFKKRVAGSRLAFSAASYQALWRSWRQRAPAHSWLARHLDALESRYKLAI